MCHKSDDCVHHPNNPLQPPLEPQNPRNALVEARVDDLRLVNSARILVCRTGNHHRAVGDAVAGGVEEVGEDRDGRPDHVLPPARGGRPALDAPGERVGAAAVVGEEQLEQEPQHLPLGAAPDVRGRRAGAPRRLPHLPAAAPVGHVDGAEQRLRGLQLQLLHGGVVRVECHCLPVLQPLLLTAERGAALPPPLRLQAAEPENRVVQHGEPSRVGLGEIVGVQEAVEVPEEPGAVVLRELVAAQKRPLRHGEQQGRGPVAQQVQPPSVGARLEPPHEQVAEPGLEPGRPLLGHEAGLGPLPQARLLGARQQREEEPVQARDRAPAGGVIAVMAL